MTTQIQYSHETKPFNGMNNILQYISSLQPMKRKRNETNFQTKRKIDSSLFSWKKKDDLCDYYDNLTRLKNEKNGIQVVDEVDNSKALVLYVKPSFGNNTNYYNNSNNNYNMNNYNNYNNFDYNGNYYCDNYNRSNYTNNEFVERSDSDSESDYGHMEVCDSF